MRLILTVIQNINLYGKNVCLQSRREQRKWWRKQIRHHGYVAQLDGKQGCRPRTSRFTEPGTWQPRPMGRLVVVHLDYPLWFCWGGNGFGNRFGNGGGLPAELNGDVGREYLMSAIQGNGNAINQLASSLNCSTQQLQSALCNIQGLIANVGNQVGMSSQQIINAFQSGNQAVLTQLADCCCKIRQQLSVKGMKAA